jgi:hypothetical protein
MFVVVRHIARPVSGTYRLPRALARAWGGDLNAT